MNNRSSIFPVLVTMVIVMLFISAIVLGSQGKTKMSYSAEVTVQNGALTGDNGQSIYMKAPGEECTFEVTADGEKGIQSDIFVYKDSSMKESLLSLTATEDGTTSEPVKLSEDAVFLMVKRSIAQGATVADGTYKISYSVRVKRVGGGGKVLLTLLVSLVIIVLAFLALNYENNKSRTCNKRQLRLRGRAYTYAFMVLAMTVLAFAFLSALVDQFPFSIYQVGTISFLVSAMVFLIMADRSRAFKEIRQKRGTLVIVFAIVAGINLFMVMLNLIMKKTASASYSGTGVIGDWIVNLVAAVCFFVMMMELLMQDAREQAEREESRR